jgi:hypothetical protein
MSWRAFVHPSLPLIETCYADAMTPDDLQAAVAETIRLAMETGHRLFLGDCTALRQAPSASDIYAMFEAIARTGLAHEAREAMLLPEVVAPGSDVAENLRFFEDLSVNRGFRVQVFADRQAALDWLVPPA